MVQSPIVHHVEGPKIEISTNNVNKALAIMKNGKASGPEGIPIELIKCGPRKLIEIVAWIFQEFANGDPIPESWKLGWITPVHKKGSRKQCKNYRCITVTSSFSRLYGRVLRNIVEEEYSPFEIEQQSGFRAGRTCIDNIFTINQVTEKKATTGRNVHLLFVDLTRAYDTVPTRKLWQILEKTAINTMAIEAIKQLYNDARLQVKINGVLSETLSNAFQDLSKRGFERVETKM